MRKPEVWSTPMRILYHFQTSPFARRVRLALLHKGLAADLRDVRADPRHREDWLRASPYETVPLLIEPDGRALGESTGITHYLDRAYPDTPRVWPAAPADAFLVYHVAGLTDVVQDVLATILRGALPDHPEWERLRGASKTRADKALAELVGIVAKLDRPTIAGGGWSGADMWLYSLLSWMRKLPERAKTAPAPARLVASGIAPPAPLLAWADRHAARADTAALEAPSPTAASSPAPPR
jgi:glutathione S-transferase